jgi:sialidase-1
MSKPSIQLFFFCLCFNFLACKTSLQLSQTEVNSSVFVQNEAGYNTFRIPAIIKTTKGTLIAFAEGRKTGRSDTGNIDLVAKRSKDNGRTWSALQVIWDDKDNTCGNPAPIVDEETGDIILLSTWNLGSDHESRIIQQTSEDTRRIFVLKSEDEGKTWSKPREITKDVKLPNWTWYATGPGSGIQLTSPKHKGRLIVGCDHIEAGTKKYFSHTIYSDDHGATWQLGGSTPKDQVNECEVAELSNGDLMLNMRNYDRKALRNRQVAISQDGGLTWKDQRHDMQLIEPRCQASLQNYQYKNQPILIFSNPAHETKRRNMCIRLSLDDGKSWTDSLVLQSSHSAYSDLVISKKRQVGCLYETGEKHPYERIVYMGVSF